MEEGLVCGLCINAELAAKRKDAGKKRHVFCYACEEDGGRVAGCAHGKGNCGLQMDKKCVEDRK